MTEPTSNPRLARDWPILLVLVGIQFGQILDFDVLLPLGPRYQGELHLSPAQFGLVVSAYSVAACLSGLLTATSIERFDRKRALLFLQAGLITATLLCGLAWSFEVLLVSRCLAGVFGGVLGPVVFALLADLIPEQRRGWATGVVLTAFPVATIAGIPLGLTLAQTQGTGSPFLALAGFCTVVFFLAAWLLPSVPAHARSGQVISPWQVLVQPALLRSHVFMMAVILGWFILVPYLPTFLLSNVGWQESDLRWLYLCGGSATLVMNPFLGRLADRFGKLLVFRALALLTLIPVLLVTNGGPAPLAVTLVLTTAWFVCSSGQTVPAIALITSAAPPAIRGSFLAVNASLQQLAMGLAAVLAGCLVSQAGPGLPLEHYPLVGLLACVMTGLAIGLAGAIRSANSQVSRRLDQEAFSQSPRACSIRLASK